MTELRDAVAAAKEFLEWMPSYDDEIIQVIRVEDVEDAVAAAISAWNRRADDWQPIETAPRDGRDVLLHFPETDEEGDEQIAGYWNCEWMMTGVQGAMVTPLDYRRPTHWRPMPKGPGG